MYKLALLAGLALMTAGTSGCFHNSCGGWRPGGLLFGNRQPAPTAAALPCCPPVQVQCCDPCAGATMGAPVMGAPMMGAPMAAPCCQ